MTTVREIFDFLNSLAPLELQMSFDNAGFQLGRLTAPVKCALLALDVSMDVIDEAIERGAQLIVAHHPLIFGSIKNITDEKLLKLVENRLSVISMHTNLDIAEGGVNDVLINLLGANCEGALDIDGCGRIGSLPEAVGFDEFLAFCKKALSTKGLRYYSAGRKVEHLAVMGGAGGNCVRRAYDLGCDTYVTADIKYDHFLLAKELRINLIDGDHFCTENPAIFMLEEKLSAAFPEVNFNVSERHGQVISFI